MSGRRTGGDPKSAIGYEYDTFFSAPSTLESDAPVAIVLDHSTSPANDKDQKPVLKVASSDPAIQAIPNLVLFQ